MPSQVEIVGHCDVCGERVVVQDGYICNHWARDARYPQPWCAGSEKLPAAEKKEKGSK